MHSCSETHTYIVLPIIVLKFRTTQCKKHFSDTTHTYEVIRRDGVNLLCAVSRGANLKHMPCPSTSTVVTFARDTSRLSISANCNEKK